MQEQSIWTTVMIRRVDCDRLKLLAKLRANRAPRQRRYEHRYEVITRALDLLEKTQNEESRKNVREEPEDSD